MSQSYGPNPGDRQAMITPFSPLGKGFLTGTVNPATSFAEGDIRATIRGSPRRLEENAASTRVALSADDVADLNAAAARIGVEGNRHNDLHMGLVGR
jgi:aryl-alcohol dehydrogenase-like predicted oxidoreductase